jgi:hypothetical protein
MFSELASTFLVPSPGGGAHYVNPYDFFGLSGTAHHRRVAHDPYTSSIIAFNEVGQNGIPLANLHLQLDAIGEELRKANGATGRDLIEAMMNYSIEQSRKRKPRNLPSRNGPQHLIPPPFY